MLKVRKSLSSTSSVSSPRVASIFRMNSFSAQMQVLVMTSPYSTSFSSLNWIAHNAPFPLCQYSLSLL